MFKDFNDFSPQSPRPPEGGTVQPLLLPEANVYYSSLSHCCDRQMWASVRKDADKLSLMSSAGPGMAQATHQQNCGQIPSPMAFRSVCMI